MNRFAAFAVSAGLTVLFLVVAGAVISGLSRQGGATSGDTALSTQVQQPADTPQPLYDGQAVQALIDRRDAIYSDALKQASGRLAQANAQLDQAYKDRDQALLKLQELQSAQAQTQPAPEQPLPPAQAALPPAPPEPNYAVSTQDAAMIAARVAPGSSLTAVPTLVNFQGTVAYEVLLDAGAVYVDANTGKVLYNGAAPQAVNNTSQNGAGVQDDHEDSGGDD